jgi:hypothetical protein
MIRTAIAAVVALSLVGSVVSCDEEVTGPQPGEPFALGFGDRVTLGEVSASIRFAEVSDDSRCPTQVECVWAGDGAVLLEIMPTVGDVTAETLHTNPESGPRSTIIDLYELALVRLDPYPEVPGGIAAEDYRATLVLRARPDVD